MKITIQFHIDNDAFVDNPIGETEGVINQATERFLTEFERYNQLFRQWHHLLRDTNGNRIGYIEVRADEVAPVE